MVQNRFESLIFCFLDIEDMFFWRKQVLHQILWQWVVYSSQFPILWSSALLWKYEEDEEQQNFCWRVQEHWRNCEKFLWWSRIMDGLAYYWRERSILFPSMANAKIKGFGKDTNAQECTVRWIQEGCLKKPPNMMECLWYLFQHSYNVHLDYNQHRFGYETR